MTIAEHARHDGAVTSHRSRLAAGARTLLYLVTAVPLGTVGAALLLGGWTVVLVLAITPLVVPAVVAFRAAVGAVARIEGSLANALLETRTAPRTSRPGPSGYWRRAATILGDPAFWRQQVFSLLRFVLGGTLAVAELSLLAASLGFVALPAWYRWADMHYGSWDVDTLGRAFLFVPSGLAGLAVAVAILRPLGSLSRSLAVDLLGGEGTANESAASPVAVARRRRALETHAAVTAAIAALLTVIWAATTPGRSFWPVWTLIPLAGALAVHAWTDHAVGRKGPRRFPTGIEVLAGVAAVIGAQLVALWGASAGGYFWPVWPLVGLVLVVAVSTAVGTRYRRQSERIAQLEATRAGAVDQQGADLRRIERDLHDGAQAQLVALGMSIGMAEQKLATDPGAAQELLAEARRSAQDALEELRRLARGIHPPVLTDRGLEGAIETLADRTPLDVRLAVDLDRRPADAVETAAYYVVAEALANAGKHAHATRVDIVVRRGRGGLVVEIADDGRGGADPAGNGLRGLARRVEALDGALTVTSPEGGPTVVRATVPCAS